MVSKIDRFIFFELNVQEGKYEEQKIKNKNLITDKLINLIAVQDEDDVNYT